MAFCYAEVWGADGSAPTRAQIMINAENPTKSLAWNHFEMAFANRVQAKVPTV